MTMEGHDDFHSEPIRGLPETPPPGERILWQGSPLWWELAKQVFHVRGVAVYFLLLTAWRCQARHGATLDGQAVVTALLLVLPWAVLSLSLLALLAWLCGRTTVYTITNRRVVMRIGIALPITVNIPFTAVGSADLCLRRAGSGDILLSLTGPERIAYSNFWPHVRPWRLRNPEPMLRAIPDVETVAGLLAAAVQETLSQNAAERTVTASGGSDRSSASLSTSLGLSS